MAKAVNNIEKILWSDKVATMSLEQFKAHVDHYVSVGTLTVKPNQAQLKKAYDAAVEKAGGTLIEKKVEPQKLKENATN